VACRQLVEHDAERPDVRAVVRDADLEQFRRQIGQRSCGRVGGGFEGRGRPRLVGSDGQRSRGDAEVEDLCVPVRRDHDVRRFQIAMDDAAFVGVFERVGELDAETQHAQQRRRVRAEVGGQQPALNQFHRDVDVTVRFADVVDRADVRMIQRGGGSGLLQ
jgi:hypothetical protein